MEEEDTDEVSRALAADLRSTSNSSTSTLHGAAGLAAAQVPRAALLARLLASEEPVIAIVAPPGYGKSTLVAQWAARRGPRVAWIACDRIHDDPLSLYQAVVAAITLIEPVSGAGREVVGEDMDRLVEHLAELLGRLSQPVAIVLDQLEALSNHQCRKNIAALAMAVPLGSQLVLTTRAELPLPAARMRVEQRLLEIGTDDLAMSHAEASHLLAAAGVVLPEAKTRQLVSQTEGWPAALYLAALASRAGDVTAAHPFSGNDRLMRDYLRSEVLDRLPPSQRKFMVRTSILDRVSGPLGDGLVGGSAATRLLDRLHRRNLLVTRLDGEGEWYRYHPLLRHLLQADLRSEHSDLATNLHARAATWFNANGDPERAVDHAHLAGDATTFGRLVLESMQPVWASGHIDTVERWMEQSGRRAPEPRSPAMIAHGALIFALLGRPGDAERWAGVAERWAGVGEALPTTGLLPDGDTVQGTLAYLRANLCREGVGAMLSDAAEALTGLGPASPYRATMVHTEGLAYLLEGDLERADASFAHAFDLAASLDASPVTSLVLAEQFQVAAARDDWTAAESLIKRALEVVTRGPYDEYWTSALVFASAARAAAFRGDMHEARSQARRAARLRPLLTYALPVVSVQALVELARAYLALVDPSGARAVLDQARSILNQRPNLGTLTMAARQLEERVSQITAATPLGSSSLTAAELRLVPLLSTHLTYAEIGDRLFVSRHTVKTQTGSIYRKLDVSSRAGAVQRIIELGLI